MLRTSTRADWKSFHNLLNRVHAPKLRHREVENDEVRLQLQRLTHRLTAVRRLANHFPPALRLENLAQAFADQRVVVG
jgi:hypothetical protein